MMDPCVRTNAKHGSAFITPSKDRKRAKRALPGAAARKLASGAYGNKRKDQSQWDLNGNNPALREYCAPCAPSEEALGDESASRALVDISPLVHLISENAVCKRCRKKGLILSFPTHGIIAVPKLTCSSCENKDDPWEVVADVPKVKLRGVSQNKNNVPTNVDYAANVDFVMGMIAAGDGGTEAAKVLGFLDLPCNRSAEQTYFSRIEQKLKPSIQKVANDAV
jgi:hypothetical protein